MKPTTLHRRAGDGRIEDELMNTKKPRILLAAFISLSLSLGEKEWDGERGEEAYE